MTETPELEDAGVSARPSPKHPDRRPSPPEAQPIPPTAEVDYLDPDGEVTTGGERNTDRRRSNSASLRTDDDRRS